MKGEYIGFSIDNIHSSTLGLIRRSTSGGRFEKNLLPSMSSVTTNKPGRDGVYYFGKTYTQLSIDLNIAYDELTDSQVRTICLLLGDKATHKLVLDEEPYKEYTVVVSGQPTLQYMAYSDYDDDYTPQFGTIILSNPSLNSSPTPINRVFRGELTLSFDVYDPFAHSRTINGVIFKYKDQFEKTEDFTPILPEWYIGNTFSNVLYSYNEWKDAVPMVHSYDIYHGTNYTIDEPNIHGVYVYNGGDMEAPFNLVFFGEWDDPDDPGEDRNRQVNSFKIQSHHNSAHQMHFADFVLSTKDYGFRINTKLGLIEGIDKNKKPTGNIYNRYNDYGYFFNLSLGEDLITFEGVTTAPTIDYTYIYY